MGECCDHNHGEFDGQDKAFKRVLVIVTLVNFIMFIVEMVAGHIANSQALQADALDFLADAATYAISLAVIGRSLKTRATAALAKGISLSLIALWVLGSTVYNVFFTVVPEAEVMGAIAILAFAANAISVLLLMKWREGDANVRSVWLCSRNDAISNLIVLVAAIGVFGTGTAWPDLIVAAIMAGLFFSSSVQIIRKSLKEMAASKQPHTPIKDKK